MVDNDIPSGKRKTHFELVFLILKLIFDVHVVFVCLFLICLWYDMVWDRRDCDRMVAGFTTTYAFSAYHH